MVLRRQMPEITPLVERVTTEPLHAVANLVGQVRAMPHARGLRFESLLPPWQEKQMENKLFAGQIVNTPKGKGKIIELAGKEALVRVPPIGAGKYVFMCADELTADLVSTPLVSHPQAAAD